MLLYHRGRGAAAPPAGLEWTDRCLTFKLLRAVIFLVVLRRYNNYNKKCLKQVQVRVWASLCPPFLLFASEKVWMTEEQWEHLEKSSYWKTKME